MGSNENKKILTKQECARCGKPLDFAGANGRWNCNNPDCPEPWEVDDGGACEAAPPLEESAVARAKLKMLARMVTGNKHLEAILAQSDPGMRRAVYEEIKPHLRFKPSWAAMKFGRRTRPNQRRKRGKVE